MKADQLNYLNIGLMIASFLLAVKLPFEVFLFSYAVLGPLHYLTEIGWLKEKNYFTTNKKDAWILVVLCLFMTLAFSYNQLGNFELTKTWTNAIDNSMFKPVKAFLIDYERSFVFLAFYTAIMMTFIKKKGVRYILMIVGVVIAYFLNGKHAYTMIVGVMLPTVIHVYLFTGAFILFGALKSKSTSGYASLGVFMVILFLIVYQNPNPANYDFLGGAFEALQASTFIDLSYGIAEFLGWAKAGGYAFYNEAGDLILRPIAIKMQIFVAFAYTYHYLNWFSKTKVINWHTVSKPRLYSAIAIWICSVALYIYDYKVGLIALFFLSVLHVFLEFPLNHLTFAGIYKELKSRVLPSK